MHHSCWPTSSCLFSRRDMWFESAQPHLLWINEVLTCLLWSLFQFPPVCFWSIQEWKGKAHQWDESTGDKNLGDITNSLGGILKMQFYLDKWKTWTEICKRKFNKVTHIGRNENRGFIWAKSSLSNTAK